jgi:hypothetical protein
MRSQHKAYVYGKPRHPGAVRAAISDIRVLGALASFAFLGAVALQPAFSMGIAPHKKKHAAQSAGGPTFQTAVAPVVAKYCSTCHSGKDAPGGIDFAKVGGAASLLKQRDVWDKVVENVNSMHMPPPGNPKPTAAQRQAMTACIEASLNAACKLSDPGRVTVRRLNRQEYNNTIRDLVGVDFNPSQDFPSDDVGYGFDNIGDVLSVSPLLTEKYLAAAEQIAQAAIPVSALKHNQLLASEMTDDKGHATDETPATLFTEGSFNFNFAFPKIGLYRLKIRAAEDAAGPEDAKMAVLEDGAEIQRFDVTTHRGSFEDLEMPLKGDGDSHKFAVRFLNDYYNAKDPPGRQDRNLVVESAELIGPLNGDGGRDAPYRKIMVADPQKLGNEEAARRILANFATRAFRRPVSGDEVDRLMKLYDLTQKAGQPFEQGIQLGVEAVLVSPNFLFRVERDPHSGNGSGPLDDFDLASRLSYFLWSSMPDDRLFELAREGKLHKPTILASEATRMLQDPRAQSLADNFAGQWLELKKLQTFTPSQETAPDWNDSLRSDMITETKDFFNAVVSQDRSVIDFLDGRFTYLNEDLAKHYGISGVYGPNFVKVALTDGNRAGILTQGAVLSVTSNPTRTSPTKRGKWVLEQILGTPPPPPPPGVGTINNEGQQLKGTTLRQLMEEHRKNPMCAACHARMDPIGFGLENFDPTGRWRTLEGKFPIDSSGILPDGRKFNGPAQLRTILLSNKDGFVHCLSEKLLTYALGRGVDSGDKCAVDKIVAQTKSHQYRFSALVSAIVTSDPFRLRGSDKGTQ